ncbi:hypothetical protein OpiT1DRAFT_05996 [Opitutaceae bacterium TAV1]|nr:hypothetical protein OpiT1DRAFT_05996 [Opitutaceae bacterium TAV1]
MKITSRVIVTSILLAFIVSVIGLFIGSFLSQKDCGSLFHNDDWLMKSEDELRDGLAKQKEQSGEPKIHDHSVKTFTLLIDLAEFLAKPRADRNRNFTRFTKDWQDDYNELSKQIKNDKPGADDETKGWMTIGKAKWEGLAKSYKNIEDCLKRANNIVIYYREIYERPDQEMSFSEFTAVLEQLKQNMDDQYTEISMVADELKPWNVNSDKLKYFPPGPLPPEQLLTAKDMAIASKESIPAPIITEAIRIYRDRLSIPSSSLAELGRELERLRATPSSSDTRFRNAIGERIRFIESVITETGPIIEGKLSLDRNSFRNLEGSGYEENHLIEQLAEFRDAFLAADAEEKQGLDGNNWKFPSSLRRLENKWKAAKEALGGLPSGNKKPDDDLGLGILLRKRDSFYKELAKIAQQPHADHARIWYDLGGLRKEIAACPAGNQEAALKLLHRSRRRFFPLQSGEMLLAGIKEEARALAFPEEHEWVQLCEEIIPYYKAYTRCSELADFSEIRQQKKRKMIWDRFKEDSAPFYYNSDIREFLDNSDRFMDLVENADKAVVSGEGSIDTLTGCHDEMLKVAPDHLKGYIGQLKEAWDKLKKADSWAGLEELRRLPDNQTDNKWKEYRFLKSLRFLFPEYPETTESLIADLQKQADQLGVPAQKGLEGLIPWLRWRAKILTARLDDIPSLSAPNRKMVPLPDNEPVKDFVNRTGVIQEEIHKMIAREKELLEASQDDRRTATDIPKLASALVEGWKSIRQQEVPAIKPVADLTEARTKALVFLLTDKQGELLETKIEEQTSSHRQKAREYRTAGAVHLAELYELAAGAAEDYKKILDLTPASFQLILDAPVVVPAVTASWLDEGLPKSLKAWRKLRNDPESELENHLAVTKQLLEIRNAHLADLNASRQHTGEEGGRYKKEVFEDSWIEAIQKQLEDIRPANQCTKELSDHIRSETESVRNIRQQIVGRKPLRDIRSGLQEITARTATVALIRDAELARVKWLLAPHDYVLSKGTLHMKKDGPPVSWTTKGRRTTWVHLSGMHKQGTKTWPGGDSYIKNVAEWPAEGKEIKFTEEIKFTWKAGDKIRLLVMYEAGGDERPLYRWPNDKDRNDYALFELMKELRPGMTRPSGIVVSGFPYPDAFDSTIKMGARPTVSPENVFKDIANQLPSLQ